MHSGVETRDLVLLDSPADRNRRVSGFVSTALPCEFLLTDLMSESLLG